jgi:putative ubiquitin-RnfH superfamily antitoxin RatB of RatAB toxin-antitoxin module
MAEGDVLRVTVLYSPAPRLVLEWHVSVAAGACVLEVLQASGLAAEAPDLDPRQAAVSIWGRSVGQQERVRDGDRIEILRALRVNPKVARRERFRQQGTRVAGLFARRDRG